MYAGRARRTAVSRPLGATIRTTIGPAIVHAGRARRTAIGRPLGATIGPAVGSAVMYAGRARRTAVSRPLGATVRTTIGPAVRSPVVDVRCAVGAAVLRAFPSCRVLLGVRHISS